MHQFFIGNIHRINNKHLKSHKVSMGKIYDFIVIGGSTGPVIAGFAAADSRSKPAHLDVW
jgi:hypothetical protein